MDKPDSGTAAESPAELRREHRRRRPARAASTTAAYTPASRPSPTATCTSATPRRSASTSAWPPEYGGLCNLRFDDTNPTKEEEEYVESIQHDVRWLGFDWGTACTTPRTTSSSSTWFAVTLIEKGKAYVDDLTAEEIRDTAAR